MPVPPLRLGVNIDHVATLRNARGGAHPDPVRAAHAVLAAGADGITFHLREDRRHIRDDDVRAPQGARSTAPLNFEMAATAEMMAIALATRPHACCLVPERREERTTEGGLDAAGAQEALKPYVGRLVEAGIQVSLFIAPDPAQIAAAAAVGAPAIEFHTGHWADFVAAGRTARGRGRVRPHRRRRPAGPRAGHRGPCRPRPRLRHLGDHRRDRREIVELNIGHFIIGEAVFEGLDSVIRAHARGDGPRPRPGGGAGRSAMILGLGSDLIDIRRIEKTLERHGERFIDRVFTDVERAAAERRVTTRRHLRQALRRQGGLRQGARHRLQGRGVLARHGGGQPAGRPADPRAHRRGRRRASPP